MAYLLIVDDDPEFAGSVATICQASGHEVRIVHAPDQALASITERRPKRIFIADSPCRAVRASHPVRDSRTCLHLPAHLTKAPPESVGDLAEAGGVVHAVPPDASI